MLHLFVLQLQSPCLISGGLELRILLEPRDLPLLLCLQLFDLRVVFGDHCRLLEGYGSALLEQAFQVGNLGLIIKNKD